MTKKELFKKLDELGVKSQFLYNRLYWKFPCDFYLDIKNYDFGQCVGAAFNWAKSPEGYNFWLEISKKS